MVSSWVSALFDSIHWADSAHHTESIISEKDQSDDLELEIPDFNANKEETFQNPFFLDLLFNFKKKHLILA